MGEIAVKSALAEAMEAGDELDPELDLFAEPNSEQGRTKLAIVVRGPGRPAGSKNRRTLRSVEMLLSAHLDPRAKALWIVEQHPADLAVLWDCSIFEAAQEQRLWALGVLPYIAAKITPEIIDNRQVIHLTIGTTAETGAADAGQIRVLDSADYEHVAERASAQTDDEPTG